MPRFRSTLGRLTIVWLLAESVSLAFVPAVLWTADEADALVCTCSHGDHAFCPMHHPLKPGSKRCGMRGLADLQIGVVASLLGPLGLLPGNHSYDAPSHASSGRTSAVNAAVLRAAPPDPPPPRR